MAQPIKFTAKDVEILDKQTVYQGFFQMNAYQLKHRLYDGETSRILRREIFERGHAVAVLPYDPVLDEFVLIQQFRLGAMATCENPWLIEIIAGVIDEGETPESVAKREASEEAGLEIRNLHKALSYLSSPGGTTERIHVYVGQVDASEASGVHGLDYEGEDIMVHRVPVSEARDWLDSGKIDNAASVIALQWFLLNKQMVIDEWNRIK